MKKKMLNNKLALNKEIVANLNEMHLNQIMGGSEERNETQIPTPVHSVVGHTCGACQDTRNKYIGGA